jgi:hydroxymethylbilane synthase
VNYSLLNWLSTLVDLPLSVYTNKMDKGYAVVRIGSRKTPLALAQTELVRTALKLSFPELRSSVITMDTMGDLRGELPLNEFGEKGLFIRELELALQYHKVDMVVNSLKDMPTALPIGMTLAAVLEREDPRDVLVLHPRYQSERGITDLASLPNKSVVGTSSLRRSSQLLAKYPHLIFRPIVSRPQS